MNIDKQQLSELARKGLKVASEVAGVAVQLGAHATPLGIASVVAKAAHTMLEQRETAPLRGWLPVRGCGPLDAFSLRVAASRKLVEPLPTNDKLSRVMAGSVHGVRLAWIEYERWIDGPYTSPTFTSEQAVSVLRALVWEHVGREALYIQPPIGSAKLEHDPIGQPLPSGTALEIWELQREFIAAGRRRSVLLAGEPGVGKSTIIRYLATQAGGHRLRIRARDLEHLLSLAQLIDFLRPDVVAIDDLDRAKDKSGILDELDALMASARLLIVTVNKLKALDGASIRRFNTMRTIEVIDTAVVDRLLDGVPEEIAARLRPLPVKYLDEYRDAVEVLGHERAAGIVDDLVAQHELVSCVMAGSPAAGAKT